MHARAAEGAANPGQRIVDASPRWGVFQTLGQATLLTPPVIGDATRRGGAVGGATRMPTITTTMGMSANGHIGWCPLMLAGMTIAKTMAPRMSR